MEGTGTHAHRALNVVARTISRFTSATAVIASMACALLASSASAASTVEITVGSEPVESITTQLGLIGSTEGSGEDLYLSVKPAGGEGCGANPSADKGSFLIFAEYDSGRYSVSRNWKPEGVGAYLLCAWIVDNTESGSEVRAQTSKTIAVRAPHLALSVSAPASVQVGQTFQVSAIAQAEATRELWAYIIPSTAAGCPANGSAVESTYGYGTELFDAQIDGGPESIVHDETIEVAGTYLVCAYFEYPDTESPPEATASAVVSVMAPPAPPPPCIVPELHDETSLATAEDSLRAAGCAVGAVKSAARKDVPKGDVIHFAPKSGENKPGGTAVQIVVSAGPPCVVPKIGAGTIAKSAEAAITKANCTVGKLAHRSDRHFGRGLVLSVRPKTGSKLAPGSAVALVVSAGPPRDPRLHVSLKRSKNSIRAIVRLAPAAKGTLKVCVRRNGGKCLTESTVRRRRGHVVVQAALNQLRPGRYTTQVRFGGKPGWASASARSTLTVQARRRHR